MTFEEKFLELIEPLFDLLEPDDDATEERFKKYFEVEERTGPLKAGLANLAKGDPLALGDIIAFLDDEDCTEFLAHPHAASLVKILALASNITPDTWSVVADEDAPYQVKFLLDNDRIDQPYSASGSILTHFFYNSDETQNSVAFVDFRSDPEVSQLSQPEVWSPQGHDLVEAWTIILLLQNVDEVEGCVAVISPENDTEKAVAYIRYHLVMSGNKLTLPVLLPTANHMSDVQPKLNLNMDYTQFTEPFTMLSQVNCCDSMIDTFLSTYHVLENYMIRSEVSAVLSNTTGRSFQRVRDFKRLGQQTDASEVAHLSKMFKRCWAIVIGTDELSASLGQSFLDTKADPRWSEDNFDEFLVDLGMLNGNGKQITLKKGFQDEENVRNNFAKLVYSIRCSIVHNKATEFHISNEELRRKDIRAHVIENMCLPVMQRLAFGLPSTLPATNPIHYEQRELMFY